MSFFSLLRISVLAVLVGSPLGAQSLAIPAGSAALQTEAVAPGTGLETFAVPSEVRTALESLGSAQVSKQLVVDAFPVGPFRREAVRFERMELWSEGAQVHTIDNGVERVETPQKTLYLRATSLESNADLSVKIVDGKLSGFVRSDAGMFVIEQSEGDRSLHVVHSWQVDESLQHTCGNQLARTLSELKIDPTEVADPELARQPAVSPVAPFDPAALDATFLDQVAQHRVVQSGAAGLRQAVVAVDTDSSFMAEISDATGYMEDLFSVLNVFYESDLGLRLVIGDTFLRSGSDPYTNTDSPVSSAGLSQFRNYWENPANGLTGIERAFVMLLSGESSAANTASGRAYVNAYCNSFSYSVNQIFYNSSAAQSVGLVGHELGHNAGSQHTHCYSPPVDTCYASEGGCYGGGTSCPAGGNGTLMSYCHIAGCGSNRLEFHPTVIGQIVSRMDANTPGCVTPLVPASQIFADGFESGSSSNWN